jgi:hypothetical protein
LYVVGSGRLGSCRSVKKEKAVVPRRVAGKHSAKQARKVQRAASRSWSAREATSPSFLLRSTEKKNSWFEHMWKNRNPCDVVLDEITRKFFVVAEPRTKQRGKKPKKNGVAGETKSTHSRREKTRRRESAHAKKDESTHTHTPHKISHHEEKHTHVFCVR